jgi:hypothetical protein
MIEQQDMLRIARLQERIYRCIEDELAEDGGHKSYEGALDICFRLPSIFDREETGSWEITLHCYVMQHLDGRHHSVSDKTLSGAIAKAEQLIGSACEKYEFMRFSREMDKMMDDPSELEGAVVYGENKHGENPF